MMLYYTYEEPRPTYSIPRQNVSYAAYPQRYSVVDDSRRRYMDLLLERERAEQAYYAAVTRERRIQQERAARDAYMMAYGLGDVEDFFDAYVGYQPPRPRPRPQYANPFAPVVAQPVAVPVSAPQPFAVPIQRAQSAPVAVRNGHNNVVLVSRNGAQQVSQLPLNTSRRQAPVPQINIIITPTVIAPSNSSPTQVPTVAKPSVVIPAKDVATPNNTQPSASSLPSTSGQPSGADLHRSPALFIHPQVAAILRERLRSKTDHNTAAKSIDEIESQLKSVIVAFADVLFGSAGNVSAEEREKTRKAYVQSLDQLLERLDAIESGEDEGLRERRREVVRSIQVALEMIEGGLTWERDDMAHDEESTTVELGKGKEKDASPSVSQAPVQDEQETKYVYDAMSEKDVPAPDAAPTAPQTPADPAEVVTETISPLDNSAPDVLPTQSEVETSSTVAVSALDVPSPDAVDVDHAPEAPSHVLDDSTVESEKADNSPVTDSENVEEQQPEVILIDLTQESSSDQADDISSSASASLTLPPIVEEESTRPDFEGHIPVVSSEELKNDLVEQPSDSESESDALSVKSLLPTESSTGTDSDSEPVDTFLLPDETRHENEHLDAPHRADSVRSESDDEIVLVDTHNPARNSSSSLHRATVEDVPEGSDWSDLDEAL